MVGGVDTLSRAFGLTGVSVMTSLSLPSTLLTPEDTLRGFELAPPAVLGREVVRESAGRAEPLAEIEAADAGRVGGRVTLLGWLIEFLDDERERVGVSRKLKDEGGAASFLARNSALRFVRGETAGGFVLPTWMDSRLLCPGTPSKVLEGEGAAPADLDLATADGLGGVTGAAWPSLREAARVIRGATTGGAVDATVMVSERLCPGTPANVFAMDSAVARRRLGLVSMSTTPARKAAARDMRGTMSGAL